jgi:hypothetical protein
MKSWGGANDLHYNKAAALKSQNKKIHAQRLEESLSKNPELARPKRRRKNHDRPQPRGHARRAMADARKLSPLTRIVQSLGKEGIRFQMVGMSAAIIQGVPATTLDTDIWVDLPERQYIRLWNLVKQQGGVGLAPTMYALADGSLLNFIFSMTGLKKFAAEYEHAKEMLWNGLKIHVLPLERIYQSKKASARDKDMAHLPLLANVIKAHKKNDEKKK